MPQATLTVWKFDTPQGAHEALATLQDLAHEDLIGVADAATVSWNPGEKKPRTYQTQSTTGSGAMGGAFWGMLFGLIFFVPLLGAALGAATDSLAGSLTDVGIDDVFINRVRDQVTPGTSALFLMTSDTIVDKVKDAFVAHAPTDLIFTNISSDQEHALREVFADS